MTTTGGRLIFPRVGVFWGGKNLTLWQEGALKGEPLVYDVNVELGLNNSNPTGSMKWNPTGAAYEIYRSLLEQNVNNVITIRYYYEGGKSVEFQFVWAGQREVYGNDMTMTILLKSQLDGLVNADVRNTTQNYDEKASYTDALQRYQKQYGLEGEKKLVVLSEKAAQDMDKAQIENAYRESETFVSAISNLAQQNGNLVFANNLNNTISLAIHTPFTWDTEANAVLTTQLNQKVFKPEQRYGYLLGPGIINDLERSLEWQPPQSDKGDGKSKQPKVQAPRNQKGQNRNTERANQQIEKQDGAVQGVSTAKPNPGIRNADNKDGPEKQRLLQEESQSKLSTNVFMCPHLVGIKPADIVYVSSLRAQDTYIEDWIVESVSYQQTAGGVEISIGATRPFTRVGLINPEAGDTFKQQAQSLNRPGREGIEAWTRFAWALPFNTRT